MLSFSLRSSAVRLGIFLSTLVIAVILIFQLIWLKRVYRLEQKEFDKNIVKAIRGLYEDINASVYYSSHLNELIEAPEPHLYIAQLPLTTGKDSIFQYLHYELEDFDILTNCYAAIYSADSGRYIYTDLLETAGTKVTKKITIPATNRDFDHLTLYFPNRQQYVLSQMNFWIIISVVLLLVIILFGGSLYYFYRQKFLNETQKDFIHNFTHEFKTPVSVISLAAEVLKEQSINTKPEKLATYADIVAQQAEHLRKQIETLLKYSNTEAEKLHLRIEKLNVHDIVKSAVANLEPLITKTNAVLTLELNAADPFLQGDKDYLVIVIVNLIDNAIKYSRDPKIIVETANSNGKILLSVSDNGIGIPQKQIKKIFKKFYRFHQGDTYQAKGFGIGLSFVRKIVLAHDGKIKIESIPGIGSKFIIELPE